MEKYFQKYLYVVVFFRRVSIQIVENIIQFFWARLEIRTDFFIRKTNIQKTPKCKELKQKNSEFQKRVL